MLDTWILEKNNSTHPRDFLGRQVRVTLSSDYEPSFTVEGTLRSWNEYGEVIVADRHEGLLQYCWPALRIEEI